MRLRMNHVGLAVALILYGGAASAEVMTWNVEGVTREAIVFAPAASPAGGQNPLVLSFHGRGDNAQNFQHTDLHLASPYAIVVYFQGLATRDRLAGWQVERGENNDRDLKLVDVALASLRKKYNIDDDRIYATGFSNGAMFTYLTVGGAPGGVRRLRASGGPSAPVGAAEAATAAVSCGR
jgi:polyhydroxybutyrate depolymerase